MIAGLSSVLLLTGCSRDDTVTTNIVPQFPEHVWPYLLVVVYSPLLLAALAIITSVVVIVTLLSMMRAARQGRTLRRWPVVVSLVLSAVLIVSGVTVIGLRLALSWVAFG
jgi:Flp pilus assembly protein TadB